MGGFDEEFYSKCAKMKAADKIRAGKCRASTLLILSQVILNSFSASFNVTSGGLSLIRISLVESVQFNCSVISNSLKTHGLQHTRHSHPSPPPLACSNLCPLHRWCHPAISSSVIPFSCLQSFPASGSFLMSGICPSGGQSFGFSISPSNEYSGLISFRIDWFDLIAVHRTLKSLLQNRVQKHQFFGAQLSLW